jgi:CMP-N-acetylneuraminic acid synthetase
MTARLDQSSGPKVSRDEQERPIVLGVIIARGGSKRLPGKNIRPLGGKPLIAWTIEAAQCAKSLTHLIVSTDNVEIARIAEGCGASVPFLRPGELAGDTSSAVDVLRHAVSFMDSRGIHAEVVVLLQATSPFRTGLDIDAAVERLNAQQADTVISIRPAVEHAYWAWTEVDGLLTPLFSVEHMAMARQSMPATYFETGALYVVRRDVLDGGSLYGRRIVPYQMAPRAAVDIDDEEDLRLAERLLEKESS